MRTTSTISTQVLLHHFRTISGVSVKYLHWVELLKVVAVRVGALDYAARPVPEHTRVLCLAPVMPRMPTSMLDRTAML